jgi:hypothetical protein
MLPGDGTSWHHPEIAVLSKWEGAEQRPRSSDEREEPAARGDDAAPRGGVHGAGHHHARRPPANLRWRRREPAQRMAQAARQSPFRGVMVGVVAWTNPLRDS